MFLTKTKLPLIDFGPGADGAAKNALEVRKKNLKPTTSLQLIAGRVTRVPIDGGAGDEEGQGQTGLLAPPKKKRYKLTDFHIVATIGTGAFSEVKLAKQIFEEQHYALKIYKKSEIATTSKILRLKSEIELLRLMKHPFILPLLSTFQE
jgi:serine/threonine protein kinase